jgi:hypothetical protein
LSRNCALIVNGKVTRIPPHGPAVDDWLQVLKQIVAGKTTG